MLLSPRRALACLAVCCFLSLLYFYQPLSFSTSSALVLQKLNWHDQVHEQTPSQSLPYKPQSQFEPDEPIPTTFSVDNQPEPNQYTRILNNNISYPSISTRPRLSPTQAQALAEKVDHLRFNDNGFHLMDTVLDAHNKEELSRLADYIRRPQSDAVPAASPIVVLSSWHWMPCAFSEGCVPGEAIWARSVLEVLKSHNMFFLFTPYESLRQDFVKLGNDFVTHVWVDDQHVWWCFNDPKTCLRSSENPEGIPTFKLFAFTFWGSPPFGIRWQLEPKGSWSWNPLGPEWSLTPYQLPEGHFHLGYHYPDCSTQEIIPHADRQNRIIVIAKLMEYFYDLTGYDSSVFYLEVKRRTGMEIITNAASDSNHAVPPGITHLGPVSHAEYDTLLANSKLVLGIGLPIVSPTPYGSLCHGVPVVLPFKSALGGRNCSGAPALDSWCGFDPELHQHGPAGRIGKPYIHMVDVTGPTEDIYKAIEEAVSTPIESFEPEEMSMASLTERVLNFFNIDWEAYEKEKVDAGIITQPISLSPMVNEWIEKHPDPASSKSGAS